MALTSIRFALFVAVCLIVYYAFPKRIRWVVLLAASYVFYGIVCFKYMPFILLTTLSTYAGALGIERIAVSGKKVLKAQREAWKPEEKKQYKAVVTRRKKAVLIGVLLLNFGFLAVLKYYNFFADSILSLFNQFGIAITMPKMGLLLPLGISFYTFQTMGYIIDVYRSRVAAEHNPAKLALFVSFFPQIIQGPISRYSELAQQLYEPHELQYENIKYGFQLILWGLFKKMVIADRAVSIVQIVCDNPTSYSGTFIAIAACTYAVQLYADFSGGIDISRGVAQMFGIQIAENFKRPYFSTSISEYWRRWHITLGAWLKDYLFYPIAMSPAFLKFGKKTKKSLGKHVGKVLPASIATFITFLVIGIWHGANWKYVAFGLWNGAVIFLSSLLEPQFRKVTETLKIRTQCFSYRLFQMARTFIIVLIGYYFDIAASCGEALQMLKRSVTDFHIRDIKNMEVIHSFGLGLLDYAIMAVGAFTILVVSILQETTQASIRETLDKQNFWFQWAVMLIGILCILLWGVYGPGFDVAEFVYMQF